MHEDAPMTRSPVISELTKAALDRLEKALDQENEALAAFDPRNLSEYSRIKTQSLLELQRSATVLNRENTPPELMQLLTTLRQKLELNSCGFFFFTLRPRGRLRQSSLLPCAMPSPMGPIQG